MRVFEGKNVPIKAWIDYVDIEDQALQQLVNLSSMPFIYKHVAAMPDVHWGMGATIGSVIATEKAIIPAAVGVDIGCGMMAVKTPLNANDLPDNLFDIRSKIEAAVPHGRTNQGGDGDRGAWHNIHPLGELSFLLMKEEYESIIEKYPLLKPKKNPAHHLGTLGTGNHFIEICLDQNQDVWVMLHSGSRGIGNKIGVFFISKAKEEMQKYYIDKHISDIDLSYLVEHTEIFDDYIKAVNWAQKFAFENRVIMMSNIIGILSESFPDKIFEYHTFETAINCHHNYVEKERHFGKNVWLTRKGAVRARKDDLGIIPGSMGAKSFIVRGKGNLESFHSCSHGAGRSMGRNEAKKRFTLEDHIKATEGVECRKDQDVIDETPMAYKDIDNVMKSQEDLVDIIYTLKQVVCIKG
jgi:tRNA-splicing ligase RtcB